LFFPQPNWGGGGGEVEPTKNRIKIVTIYKSYSANMIFFY
jgi:hypothetical protein